LRTRNGTVTPLFIDPDDQQYRDTAEELIQVFEDHLGESKGELEGTIDELTIANTDYKVVQGLAKLLKDECQFETVAAAEGDSPAVVREGQRAVSDCAPAHVGR
jgi:predicted nuclease of restriction endonuclease-like RecB superfamily